MISLTSLAVRVALFASVAGLVGWPSVISAQPPSEHAILVLHTYGQGSPFRWAFDRALQQTLQQRGFAAADLYVEALESNRFPGDNHAALFRQYLSQKYVNRKIDVVITVWDRALNYALEHRAELFPNAPIVSLVTRGRTLTTETPVIQITAPNQFADTIRLALTLHPNTHRIAVVDGTLQSNDDVQKEITAQLAPFASQVEVEYLRDLPEREVVDRVKALPEDSVILYVRHGLRTRTQGMTTFEGLQSIAAAARVPIYTVTDQHVGRGVVGGVVFKTEALAELVAESAISSLKGAQPRDIHHAESGTVPMFDWRELQKWGIPLGQLPAHSEVLFRQFTLWEENLRYVAAALTVFLIQASLIAGLLMQRTKRRHAEGALRVNEHALQVSQEDSRRLAGRLIAAQEVERSRIARELHDDLSQKVALLAMDIHQIGLSEAPGMRGRAKIMAERAAEIGTDLHNLSHELHPAKLQLLGLVKATQFLCRDLAGRHRLDIDFVHDRMPSNVPPDPALCLFRIVQEALQNVVKHSGARSATVKLSGSPESLQLEISDSGGGFDTSKLGGGMGLLSIRERVNFLDGQLSIRSTPGMGTRIAVRVPIEPPKAAEKHATARIA